MVRGMGKEKKMQRMGESRPWQTDVPTQHSSITTTKGQASKAIE